MRQVVKDRLARIDEQITRLQGQYKTAVKDSFKKNILYEIERLCEKKDTIANHAIFGRMNMSKYQHGLTERQMNLDGAIEEQKAISEDIVLCLQDTPIDVARIKRLRAKLGNCNRIVAIYQNSMDTWIRKGATTAIIQPNVDVLNVKERQGIAAEQQPVDDEIVGYINNREANTRWKPSGNTTNIDMITRPGEKKDLRIKTIEEMREENPGFGMYNLKVVETKPKDAEPA